MGERREKRARQVREKKKKGKTFWFRGGRGRVKGKKEFPGGRGGDDSLTTLPERGGKIGGKNTRKGGRSASSKGRILLSSEKEKRKRRKVKKGALLPAR